MNNPAMIRIALALSIALLVLGAIMRSQIPPRIDLPYETTSTMIAAEFASNPEEINSVIGSDRRYARRLEMQQYVDFPFILCYVALFVLIGLALRNYDVPGARWLAWIAIACAVAAGLCDIGENIAILKSVATPGMKSSNVRWFSVPKWTLVFVTMLIESAAFFFWPRLKLWWRVAGGIVGAFFLYAGASGVLFSLLVSISDIAWTTEWVAWGMLVMAFFFAAQAIARGKQLRY